MPALPALQREQRRVLVQRDIAGQRGGEAAHQRRRVEEVAFVREQAAAVIRRADARLERRTVENLVRHARRRDGVAQGGDLRGAKLGGGALDAA